MCNTLKYNVKTHRVNAFPGRPTNSVSTPPRAAHMEGGVIGCYQFITTLYGSAPSSSNIPPTPGFDPHIYQPSPSPRSAPSPP